MVSRAYENKLLKQGFQFIAGLDEAGRGPLAGPVVAAAVVLPRNLKKSGIRNSKKLSARQRAVLFEYINENALSVGVGIVSEKIIDKINIRQASLKAMLIAVKKLNIDPDHLLIDGRDRIKIDIAQRTIIAGDDKCLSIAAASIIAKVTRDNLMDGYHKQFPWYGFDRHRGYGTRLHFQTLKKHGPCTIHRRSFSPILEMA